MTIGQLPAIIYNYAESDPTKDDSDEEDNEKEGGKSKEKYKHSSAHKRKGDCSSEFVAAMAAGGRGFKIQCPISRGRSSLLQRSSPCRVGTIAYPASRLRTRLTTAARLQRS